MTITISWINHNIDTKELILISDSRLRSYGAMDQCQKIFPLERGDCCLGFCGDAQIAYPLSVQASSALNNFIKTRTRSFDVLEIKDFLCKILNNLISSWDLKKSEKLTELKETNIFFGGWSWKKSDFIIGYFKYDDSGFVYHKRKTNLPHPFRDQNKSFLFLGDYQGDYEIEIKKILSASFTNSHEKKHISLKYEPLIALNNILSRARNCTDFPLIGGELQMVKIYQYGNTLPYVFRKSQGEHYLFGRKMFDWEKTERPIFHIQNDEVKFSYPLSIIPDVKSYTDDFFQKIPQSEAEES
ncbi:hypothetical protein [Acetobacter indonesiensis]|uniref:hypothetical protein n=1 Tax=Acetobacter indonesiensis TaxID=104101 RepID=UPI00117826BB|nr:hypothetical protein [Acetobacter indonesiensis]